MAFEISKNPKCIIAAFVALLSIGATAQSLITDIDGRNTTSLEGEWKIIIDPYENGYYSYRSEINHKNGYFKNKKPQNARDLIEYDFDTSDSLYIPGDWNSQRKELFFYEGTVWYKKSFDYHLTGDHRLFVYFGAVNYHAMVFLNGNKVGEHSGGYTPFCFEITDLVKENDNFLIVKVDNKRFPDGVPTMNMDWWNYGGITRRVCLIEMPATFIRDYKIQLDKDTQNNISGWVLLDGANKTQNISIHIDKANISHETRSDQEGYAEFSFDAAVDLWSPEDPVLYNVTISAQTDSLEDNIGFRSVTVAGDKILLNGSPVFLRGISIHEEPIGREGRAWKKEDAVKLLNQAKELGCNFVRLAHYPHNEYMVRQADLMGLMVWAEIPVYWTISWENPGTYANAEKQLNEMITRDKNRASVIIWSVANETPRGDARMKFLSELISAARNLDDTRLISAATEVSNKNGVNVIDDPLIAHLDVIGVNEYLGWYGGRPENIPQVKWQSNNNKPIIISEFGAGAKYGLHGPKEQRWTEEYQAFVYAQQLKMLVHISGLSGMSPWILKDFRSPRRPLAGIQDFWNRKGLLSEMGERKQAFFVLQKFYLEKRSEK